MQREYGYSLRGKLIEDVKPGKRFTRLNVIGAVCNGIHSAVTCYKHSTDSIFFEDWFKNTLLPAIPKGHTVIMDNARFHRKSYLKKLARGKVRLLFLPPYSPDYNPIENSWANMKRFLRGNLHKYTALDSAVYDYFIRANN